MEKAEDPRGEMTAFLALVFILLIAFAGSLMESASIQAAKNWRRADMNRAIESVFAEYQKELLEEYELFALEGSYESGSYSEEKIWDRLSCYGAGGMDHEMVRLQILSDDGGSPFLSQVSSWVKYKYGLDKLEGLLGNAQIWKNQDEEIKLYQEKEQEEGRELSSLLEGQQQSLPAENNPLDTVEQLKKSSLLSLVMPRDRQVSQKRISLSDQPSGRALEQGYGSFDDVAEQGDISRLALGVYLLEHFSSAVPEEGEEREPGGGGLDYELEYMISGQPSDMENLEKTVQKLLLIRTVSNFAYIQTDSVKRAEAAAMAAAMCALLAVPAIVEAVTQALLFAWSFGESVTDLRALLNGSRVPLVKDSESWQLQLSGLLTLGSGGEWNEGKDTASGMNYEEYLQILLFLTSADEASMRSLDLIEQHMRLEKGMEWFRIDHCITKMEIDSRCSLRRGISYSFSTYFGYN
ncbi:DUF5702 domain-containing protein [Lachnoclostridium phocaeense]|uniref:DUF5702 domain-containing protein n=1 Tax=Lachnoclostridium phocaeense TaxID=1871021 RepID=UPI00248F02E1|nr:DUF5702 domain-containing protein [Lachnoclostridium phocaeense]